MDSHICKLLLLHRAGSDTVQRLMGGILAFRNSRGVDRVGEFIVSPLSIGNLVVEAEDGDRIANLKTVL